MSGPDTENQDNTIDEVENSVTKAESERRQFKAAKTVQTVTGNHRDEHPNLTGEKLDDWLSHTQDTGD